MKNAIQLSCKRYHMVFLALCLIGSFPAWANDVVNTQEQSTSTATTQDKVVITGTAQDWGLSDAEWQHYLQLINGTDGLWYAHLSPPSVLGMRAETREEQQHFARIVAKEEHDKVARELAFNNAVFAAMRELYADEPMIKDFDKTPFNPGSVSGSR